VSWCLDALEKLPTPSERAKLLELCRQAIADLELSGLAYRAGPYTGVNAPALRELAWTCLAKLKLAAEAGGRLAELREKAMADPLGFAKEAIAGCIAEKVVEAKLAREPWLVSRGGLPEGYPEVLRGLLLDLVDSFLGRDILARMVQAVFAPQKSQQRLNAV